MQESPQTLSFQVRDGMAVHRRRRVTRSTGNGRSVCEMQISSHGRAFGSTAVSLEPHEVRAHAHSLEPTDGASAAALEALQFKPPVRGPELSYEQRIYQQAANATIQSLIAAGLLKAAPQ